jgi:hypothetical protein
VIDGKICGRQVDEHESAGPDVGYVVLVEPDELAPGCGRHGAQVSFEVVWRYWNGTITRVRDLPGAETWAPGELVKRWQ